MATQALGSVAFVQDLVSNWMTTFSRIVEVVVDRFPT
jgi:hypothetical protein